MKIYQLGSCYSPSDSCIHGSGLSDYKSNSTFSGQWISRLRKDKTQLITQDDFVQKETRFQTGASRRLPLRYLHSGDLVYLLPPDMNQNHFSLRMRLRHVRSGPRLSSDLSSHAYRTREPAGCTTCSPHEAYWIYSLALVPNH
jgi:hypothetical protein